MEFLVEQCKYKPLVDISRVQDNANICLQWIYLISSWRQCKYKPLVVISSSRQCKYMPLVDISNF